MYRSRRPDFPAHQSSLYAALALRASVPLSLPQHPDEHRSERPVLLAVDQQLGEGAALRVAPELADLVGAVEVGEHEDVEQLGAKSGPEGVEALTEPAFQLVRPHGSRAYASLLRVRLPAMGSVEDRPGKHAETSPE